MQHILFDLEATCWEKGSSIDRIAQKTLPLYYAKRGRGG